MQKPHLLRVPSPLASSYLLKGDAIAWDNPWHYHPEIELLYCIRGKGTNFVGNAIRGIEEGELLLFGKNCPTPASATGPTTRSTPARSRKPSSCSFGRIFSVNPFSICPNLAPSSACSTGPCGA